MTVDLVERAAKAMVEADLWPGAWDGNMPDGYAMSDAEKNAWTHRAEAAVAAVAPLIAAREREAGAEIVQAILDQVPKPRSYEIVHYCMGLEAAIAAIRARGDAP